MAKITIKGLDAYALRMSRLESESESVTKQAVYEGAKVIADGIKEEIKKLPIDDRHGTSGSKINGVTKKQKSDLIDGFGLTPIKNENGYIQTKAGFDGYGSTPTKKYPQGVPNQLIARSVNSGTSFRKKNPFVRRAANKNKKSAVDAMEAKADELIKKII